MVGGEHHDRIVEISLCQQFDISHALLEIAGAKVAETLESISALPAFSGKPWRGREHVFAEQSGDHNLTDASMVTMVRSHEWKLTHFLDEPYGQLFDLHNDPGECRNLWDDTDCAGIKRELLDVLREWRIKSQYHTADWMAAHR